MTPRLDVNRFPLKQPWMPTHEGCTTGGMAIAVGTRANQYGFLMVMAGSLDGVCCAALQKKRDEIGNASKRSKKEANFKSLTVYAAGRHRGVSVRIGSKIVRIPPRCYVVVNPNEIARLDAAGGFSGTIINVTQPILREFREAAGIPSTAGPFDFVREPLRLSGVMGDAVETLAGLAEEVPLAGRAVWFPLHAYTATHQLIGGLWESHPSLLQTRLQKLGYRDTLDPRLHRAVEYLRERLAGPVSHPAVAREAGLSVPTFYRMFRAKFRCSPKDYQRRLRVEAAERLLTQTPDRSLEIIAQEVGFERAWSLRKAYRAVHGLPMGAPNTPKIGKNSR